MGRRTLEISIGYRPGKSKQKVRGYLLVIMPLFSLPIGARSGLINEADAPAPLAVREYDPILFDFLLKRRLRWHGHRLGPTVFESRRVFLRKLTT
jgi:mannonate dehydratase